MPKKNELQTIDQTISDISVETLQNPVEPIGVDLTCSTEELQAQAIQDEHDQARKAAIQGFRFVEIKRRLGHSEFGKWVAEAGFVKRTVEIKMQVALFLATQPAQRQKKLIALPQKKLTALASIDPEFIRELVEGDDIEELNVTELRNKYRKLKKDHANLKTELETVEIKKEALERRRNEPDFLVVTRQESDALTHQALLCVDDLERLLHDLKRLPSEVDADDLAIGHKTLYIHLNALAKRVLHVQRQILDADPDLETIRDATADVIYPPNEVEAAARARDDIVQSHQHKKLLREDARERAKPKGRGRPKKPKVKK